jgi:hypothetical protein
MPNGQFSPRPDERDGSCAHDGLAWSPLVRVAPAYAGCFPRVSWRVVAGRVLLMLACSRVLAMICVTYPRSAASAYKRASLRWRTMAQYPPYTGCALPILCFRLLERVIARQPILPSVPGGGGDLGVCRQNGLFFGPSICVLHAHVPVSRLAPTTCPCFCLLLRSLSCVPCSSTYPFTTPYRWKRSITPCLCCPPWRQCKSPPCCLPPLESPLSPSLSILLRRQTQCILSNRVRVLVP